MAFHDIVDKPKINFVEKQISIKPGESVKLIAEITGIPRPNLVWSRSGNFLKSNGDFSLNDKNGEAILVIKKSTYDHNGIYVLTATNKHGKAVENIKLMIQGGKNN